MDSRFGKGKFVEARVFQIDHPPAFNTDQVVVPVRFNLETRRCSRVTHLPGNADTDQCVQDPIDGSPRYAWEPNRDILGDLIGCRVIVALHQDFQDSPPLNGQRETMLTAYPLQLLDLGGNRNSASHNVATILQ